MNGRTDLAMEAADQGGGLTQTVTEEEGVTVTRTVILTDAAGERLGKPPGQYVTVEVPPLTDDETRLLAHAHRIAEELTALLPPTGEILVLGLGNAAITPDALGPQAADMVLATRHIRGEWAKSLGLTDLRPVAVFPAGVLGQTGVESGEVARSLIELLHPAAVIAVDALAARSLSRLGKTVQLSDAGISPGSGVGNDRPALSKARLGVPVIGMGVPTVVDAATIVQELGGGSLSGAPEGMMVTPREVDLMVRRAARLLAMAINAALQPDYSPLSLMAAAV